MKKLDEINKNTEEKDVLLIVKDTHEETAARQILFRIVCVTSEVLNHSDKPLLIVRTIVAGDNGENCVECSCMDFRKRILCSSDISQSAVDRAKELNLNYTSNVYPIRILRKIFS